ncbi:MAG: GDYXXLXY domain-containing protein [Bacteroidota bacterium]|jgi:uncharacterized membrane-anchored protein|nr:GDYXXLXY domain-containing protein [Cytophagales bacterium]MCE2958070.1 GDYXXLXY domain-containing protein [Flammeovirgaceae bacterium]MCZ8070598.1 GDYXXLXY domain-containing protein [Cytophagales bacterium]
MKRWIPLLFALMITAQWLVPAKIIWDSESVLSDGVLYKFKTYPIDPSDPFRGKYVTLNFKASMFKTDSSTKFDEKTVFATLDNDSSGFARVVKLSNSRPASKDYIEVTIQNSFIGRGYEREFFLKFPFERFYVEESKAAEAERAYWQASRDSTQQAYALVSVDRGSAILKDVVINGRSVVDIVEELNRPKN